MTDFELFSVDSQYSLGDVCLRYSPLQEKLCLYFCYSQSAMGVFKDKEWALIACGEKEIREYASKVSYLGECARKIRLEPPTQPVYKRSRGLVRAPLYMENEVYYSNIF